MSQLTLSFKDRVLKVFPLFKGEMIVGSDPASDIHIDSLAVHPQHARISVHGADATIEDLDTPEGTFLGNEKLTGPHELQDGEVIRVGKHTLSFLRGPEPEFEESELHPAHQTPKTAWLQIMSGHNLGKTISLNRNLTNLGKPGIQTAVIARRNEGFFISHLEGKHSPLVDGEPIGDQTYPLHDGAEIQIGNVKMQFYLQ